MQVLRMVGPTRKRSLLLWYACELAARVSGPRFFRPQALHCHLRPFLFIARFFRPQALHCHLRPLLFIARFFRPGSSLPSRAFILHY
eukprot:scaffold50976_cov20-Tisochrysis_lutea.AAC.6